MRVDVLSVLPQMFGPVLGESITGRAIAEGLLEVHTHDLRTWTHDRHRTTDDYAFGGGPGMVMKPEPIFEAVAALREMAPEEPHVVLMSPQGERFTHRTAVGLSRLPRLVLVCGRYEGFDERIRSLADREISLGDFVLTGGELPALVVIDAVSRLIPGVLGHDESASDESFADGLLEYPQYTRPASYAGMDVPPVLLSGDHGMIARWRRLEAIRRTALRRPDLLDAADLTAEERVFAREIVDGMESDDRD